MRQAAREKRAEEIEAAAYKVLEEKGYAGLSMLSVAKAAKASNETIYRWYGDKQGLFEALIARNTGIVGAALAQIKGEDAIADLEVLGPVLLEMLLGPRAVALNRAAAADGSGALGRALGRIGREQVGPWVVGVITRAINDDDLSGGTADEMAEVWFALLIGDLQIRRATGALEMPTPEEIAERAQTAMGRLQALFPPQMQA